MPGKRANGAHPYLVTPEQTRNTRSVLGPDRWVVSEQAVAIGGGEADQLRRAHQHLGIYSSLPNYRNSCLRKGFDESDLAQTTSVPVRGDRLVGMCPRHWGGRHEVVRDPSCAVHRRYVARSAAC